MMLNSDFGFRRIVTMKIRGAWGSAAKSMSVGTLVCGVLLFAVSGSVVKNGLHGKASGTPAGTGVAKPGSAKENSRWAEAYGKLPMSFEENMGQTAREVRYVSHGGKYDLFLTSQEAVVALRPSGYLDFSPRHRFATLRALHEARRNAQQADRTTVLRLELEGANPQTQIAGTDPLPGRVNYFTGNDPKKWHTDVPTYAKVKYSGVYPGIDLIFYGNPLSLEYDFIVAPGANPKAVALNVRGARHLRINSRGDVILSVPGGEVALQKPVIYQEVKGERREVAGRYVIAGNHRITFSVPNYDRRKPLVLDPVLNYSTYVGGTSDDSATGIALDTNGDAFIVGVSSSTNFPTTANAFMPQPLASNVSPAFAAFVAELNPAGNTLLYSSYIAGSTPGEVAFGVAADPTGKAVYVTGQTISTDFPTNSTIPGFKTGTNAGVGPLNGTSFLVKLDPTQATGANSFVYSTFIGGTNGTNGVGDIGEGIAADSNGVAYVTGYTDATPGNTLATFPVVNGFQTTLNNSNGNAFLAKIDTTKSANALLYSTYLGGNGVNFAGAGGLGIGDAAFGVAIDSSGKAYIVGSTSSTDFNTLGTTNGKFLTYPAGNTSDAAFFCQVDTTKLANQSLLYLTYLGGMPGPDFGLAIALGPNNVAYLTGQTGSSNFPLSAGAFQNAGPVPTFGIAFVSLIDTAQAVANSLTHSTFLGGSQSDEGRGIQADSQGNAYIAGATTSGNFPLSAGALQPKLATGAFGNGFVSKLNPTLSSLLYSSYFGGSGDANSQHLDTADGIAIDSSSPPNAYIAGQTFSTNLPVAGTPVAPLHAGLNGTASDAYVAKLSLIPRVVVTPSPFDFSVQPVGVTSGAQTFTLTNNTNATLTFTSIATTGISPAANTDFVVASDACSPSVAAGTQCTVTVTFKPSTAAAESATLAFADGDVSSPQDVSLTGTGSAVAPGVGLVPTSLPFGNQALNTTSAAQIVTLTNTGAGALTINSLAASGDFAETSAGATACPISPATLAGGANCKISVTFTPTALGPRAGTLTITDNAGGSPHTVSLTGTGTSAADFTLTGPAVAPSTKDGVTLNFPVVVMSVGGFNSPVTFTCTSTPTLMLGTCSATTVTPPSNGSINSTVTVTSTAFVVPPSGPRIRPPSIRQVVPLVLALLLLFLLPTARRLRTRSAMGTAMILFLVLAGCSGTKGPHTATGPYALTIKGVSGNLNHTVVVNITIN
jgi:centrosomal CEP192-like protein/beta-propeller repeat-containing protein